MGSFQTVPTILMENRIPSELADRYNPYPPESDDQTRAGRKSNRHSKNMTSGISEPYIAAIYSVGSSPGRRAVIVDYDSSGQYTRNSAIYQGLPACFVWQLTSDPKQVLASEKKGQEVIYCSNIDELLETVTKRYQDYRFLEIRAEHSLVIGRVVFKTDSKDLDEILNLAQEFPRHWLHISNSAARALNKIKKGEKCSTVGIVGCNSEGKQEGRTSCWDRDFYLFRTSEWNSGPDEGNTIFNYLVYNPEKAKLLLAEKRKFDKKTEAELTKGDYPQLNTLFRILRSAVANHLLYPATSAKVAKWKKHRAGRKPGTGAQLTHPHQGYISKPEVLAASCRLYSAIEVLKIDLLTREDYQGLLKRVEPYLNGMIKAGKEKKVLATYLKKDLEKLNV